MSADLAPSDLPPPPTIPASPDRRTLFSALWTFVVLNYLYADVMGLMDPVLLRQYLTGSVDGLVLSRPLLLAAAVMMEVPIAMTLLARILPRRSNRVLNVVAGLLKTAAVAASLGVGVPAGYYVFFASIEIVCTLFIVYLAWTWRAD